MRHLKPVTVAAACCAMVAVDAASAAGWAPHRTRWTVTSTVDPSSQANYLTSTTAFSVGDVWAVGAWYRPDLSTPGTLTEHWNGSRWRLVSSPNVTDGYNELYDVAGAAADDVWAVGYHNIAAYGSERTMALHWNGHRWSVVATPNLGSTANELEGVHAIAPDDVWAVGFGADPGGFAGHAIGLHWNGAGWRLTDLAPPGVRGSDLVGVGGTSTSDVWAVGSRDDSTLIEHFDGASWSVVPSPDGEGTVSALSAVTAVAPNDAWAVGSSESEAPGAKGSGEGSLILHWDGESWTVVPSPNGPNPSNALLDVVAYGSQDVWAGGLSYDDLQVTSRSLVERWDGSKWRIVQTPDPDADYNVVEGIAGMSPGHLWAVGAQGSGTLAMHS
jgi:hypothetical protein